MMKLVFCFLLLPAIGLAATDPCANPSQILPQLNPSTPESSLNLLNGDVNVIPGSAKNVARCQLKSNPNITACLTLAHTSYKNGLWLVLDIYGQTTVPWSNGVLIDSNDDGSSITTSASQIGAQSSEWGSGGWHGGGEGGAKHAIALDLSSHQMTYQAWSGSPDSQDQPVWTLEQDQMFNCLSTTEPSE